MICQPCRDAADSGLRHEGCPGDTWCDCQHMPPVKPREQKPKAETNGQKP